MNSFFLLLVEACKQRHCRIFQTLRHCVIERDRDYAAAYSAHKTSRFIRLLPGDGQQDAFYLRPKRFLLRSQLQETLDIRDIHFGDLVGFEGRSTRDVTIDRSEERRVGKECRL